MKNEYDVEVEWLAFELHPEFPPEGIVREKRTGEGRKGVKSQARLMAEEVNLPLKSSTRIPNSRLALEAAEYARDRGRFEEYHRALFHAYFGEARDIGDRAVLAELAQGVGLDPTELREALENRSYKDTVQEQVDEAHELGITAVPTFVIGNRALVGCQPYHVFKLVMSSLNENELE